MSIAVLPVLWVLLAAQQTPPFLTFEGLVASIPQAPPSTGAKEVGAQEVTLTWNAPASRAAALDAQKPAPVPTNTFAVTRRRLAAGALPIERRPELSADQLVVVGAAADGSIVSWSLTRDPRIVRAEQAGPDGALSGQVLYRGSVDLMVVLPDSPQIARAGIYEPHWTGSEWELTLIGSFDLGVSR